MDMKTRASFSRHWATLALAAILASATACNSSDTITGPGAGSSINIAGTWTGTYRINPDDLECGPNELDASATFQQDETHVRGPVTAPGPCGLNSIFEGEVRGNTVTGTISLGSFHATSSGVLSDGVLRMTTVSHGWEMGVLTLHR